MKKDWHKADVICEIKKSGTTLAALSRKNGLASSTLANVMYRSWPRAEKIIAEHLGLKPHDIWPSRYK